MRCALVSFWHDIDGLLSELEQYDKIFACEKAALDLLEKGIKLEKVISDFDSVDVDYIKTLQPNIDILPSKKNETDTTALFLYIMAHYADCELTLYNEFTGRIDHALVLLSLFMQKPTLIIMTPQTKMHYVTPGSHKIKNQATYQYISFIALTQVSNIELINFQYPLKQESLIPFCDLTVSNEFVNEEDGILRFTDGNMLYIYSRD